VYTMNILVRLVLVLALIAGAFMAPDDVSARTPPVTTVHLDYPENQGARCMGDVPTENVGIACEGSCRVPCAFGGSTAVIVSTSILARPAYSVAERTTGIEPPFLIGTVPPIDPFPPKWPV